MLKYKGKCLPTVNIIAKRHKKSRHKNIQNIQTNTKVRPRVGDENQGNRMKQLVSNYRDDFLEGSRTIYNYTPKTLHNCFFYAQIVGMQNIGQSYYNELQYAKEYQIQYTMEGSGCMQVENEEYIVKKGDLVIIPNYYHHIYRPIKNTPWKIAFIHIFENPTVAEIFKRIYMKSRFVIHDVAAERIVPHIAAIMDLLDDSEHDIPAVSGHIYSLLMETCMLSDAFEGDTVDRELASVIHFLKQYYNTPITMRDILNHSSYSKNHLERIFKQRMNMTMQEYISKLRLQRAQELISESNMYYKEIANAVGLSDYRSLVYLFRKTLGITPSEYRNLHKNNDNSPPPPPSIDRDETDP